MTLTATWSYPTRVLFGPGRLAELPQACAEAGMAGFEHRLPADTPEAALIALVESAYRGDASRAGWTTEADLLERRTRLSLIPEVAAAATGAARAALAGQ